MAIKSPFIHILEYGLLRVAEAVMSFLPRKIALSVGVLIGSCLYYCGVYRKVVRKNMNYTGLYTGKQQKAIMKKLYINIGRYASDVLRSAKELPPYTIEHPEIAQSIHDAGKGGLAVMAHLGNWELLGSVFGSKYSDLHVLTKPMHNQLIERWLYSNRKDRIVTPIYVAHALRKMLEVLRRNGIIAILIDQYAGHNGTPSVFLGKPANTVRTVAGLLYKMQCGVFFAYGLLETDGIYRIVLEEAPQLDVLRENQEQFISAYQRAHNDVLSRWVITYPEHYFGWFHQRFKGDPAY